MSIGYKIGLIFFGCMALYIVYKFIKLLFHRVFSDTLPSNYVVLNSRSQLNKLSAEIKVLLITDRVFPYLGNRWAFEQNHLQKLHSLTENKNIKICWFNIFPDISLRHFYLRNYLKKNGIREKGVSLFKEGELLKYEPIRGKFDMTNEKTIKIVKKILRM